MTHSPTRSLARSPARLALGIALGLGTALATPARGQGMGMGPGMMGGTGHGMMGGAGPGMRGGPGYGTNDADRQATGQGTAAPPAWGRLSAYIGAQHLMCLSCHELSKRNIGPAFADIAHRFAGQPNARATLTQAISHGVSDQWAGYPAMPGGLATPGQAATLAQFILDLAR